MTIFKNKDDLFKKISFLKGVGPKLTKYLKNKRIEKINDLLWHFPLPAFWQPVHLHMTLKDISIFENLNV